MLKCVKLKKRIILLLMISQLLPGTPFFDHAVKVSPVCWGEVHPVPSSPQLPVSPSLCPAPLGLSLWKPRLLARLPGGSSARWVLTPISEKSLTLRQ